MKRILLLTAIYWAAATGLSLRAGNFPGGPDPLVQDTITIKLPDGVSMKVMVKNTNQLKNLHTYKLDSLMALLGRYVKQVEEMEKANKGQGAKEITMIFNPAKDLNNNEAPEQISITISENTMEKMQPNKIEKIFKVMADLDKDNDNDNNNDNDNDKDNDNDNDKDKDKRKNINKRSSSYLDIDLGLNTFVNVPKNSGDSYDLKPIGSRYISLNHHVDLRIGGTKSPFYLLTGVGFAFNNFMLDKNRYVTDQDGVTVFNKELSEVRSFEKSKLTTSSVNVPLMATLKFKNSRGKQSFKIGAGGFAGYRLGGHTKLKYQEDGKTQRDKERSSFNMEDFQYGVNFVIGYKKIELFGKYNLNDLFKDNRGPAMNVVSFGFRI
jgi:hypothetical protein